MKLKQFNQLHVIIFGILISMLLGCKKDISNVSDNIAKTKWKPSANNKVEKPLDSININKKLGSRIATTNYVCGSYISDDYYGQGYYVYPNYSLDLSGTPQGSTINVTVNSYDIPNRFTIKDENGSIVASTSWMGYVDYNGPWGSSLNTPETQTLSFVKDIASSFVLTVETVAGNNYSDAWSVGVSCTAPTLTWINPGNAGIFHNNIITSVDNSFVAYPMTLFQGDSLCKIYEKSYVNNNNINLSAAIIDSSFGFRNSLFNISYNDNVIYANRIDFRTVTDSMMNLADVSVLMTNTEKTIMQNLFNYFEQYKNGQIDYNTMKANISNLRNTWNQQGFNVTLHQGDISAYTLNIADSSVSYWYRYNSMYGTRVIKNGLRTQVLPAWVAADAAGALGGAIGAGLDSYYHTHHIDWGSVGSWAVGGAVAASLPGVRWFKNLFNW